MSQNKQMKMNPQQLKRWALKITKTLEGKINEVEALQVELASWRCFATAATIRLGGLLHLSMAEMAEVTEAVEKEASMGCTVTTDESGVTLKVEQRWATEYDQRVDRGDKE